MNRKMNQVKPIIAAMSLLFASGCQGLSAEQTQDTIAFEAAEQNIFPVSKKFLRQWDAATVVDLDQDGWPDLMLNDHGFSTQVLWNNQGRFSQPYDLLMGDSHGIAAADIDKDGQVEIIMARGGGSGSNARNAKMVKVNKNREFTEIGDYSIPLANMRGRTVKFADLDNDGFLDLVNFAFPSKEKKGQSENYLYRNNRAGELVLAGTLPSSFGDGQKVLLTDFNGDHALDIFMYGNGPARLFKNEGKFNFSDVTNSVLPEKYKQVSSAIELDYDNDGDMDLFITQGKDFESGQSFYNGAKQSFAFYSKRGKTQFKELAGGEVIYIKNLQTQWPHKSLFTGEPGLEYQFPGETHSGRNVRLVNSDALGFVDKTDKKGVYIGYVGNQAWRLAVNTFSPSTGVIDGIVKAPDVKKVEQEKVVNILLNNHQGRFTNVTKSAGLAKKGQFTSSAVADINNDGFLDIVVRSRGEMVFDNPALVYINNQKGGFEYKNSLGIVTREPGAIGLGIEAIDANLDGRVDFVVGDERGRWHLFLNQSQNQSHYLQVAVGPSAKQQASSLGAVVTVNGCKKQQQKRIGTTAAMYSISFNPIVHFGLGDCDKDLTVQVKWPTGELQVKKAVNANQKLVF
ncbi:CRTAC1 family protein [Gayadomonas joobiniege]|uniref:CRTAC1 family protein n=1 Tax=Gayadomonas joobiniege TaxID=1234606 RepID=UPI00038289C3|nr:CRTAC1 family protein [Gayadomonas joobiniege]